MWTSLGAKDIGEIVLSKKQRKTRRLHSPVGSCQQSWTIMNGFWMDLWGKVIPCEQSGTLRWEECSSLGRWSGARGGGGLEWSSLPGWPSHRTGTQSCSEHSQWSLSPGGSWSLPFPSYSILAAHQEEEVEYCQGNQKIVEVAFEAAPEEVGA